MQCAPSIATMGDNICSGRCIVHRPLPLRATKWVVEDAWCIFHCHCGRQHLQWKIHGAPSTATAGDNMGNGRYVVHLQMQLLVTTWAVEHALCSFHCDCLRQHGPWKMHGASFTATACDKLCNRRCMVHRPLPLRATTWAVADAQCIFNCH